MASMFVYVRLRPHLSLSMPLLCCVSTWIRQSSDTNTTSYDALVLAKLKKTALNICTFGVPGHSDISGIFTLERGIPLLVVPGFAGPHLGHLLRTRVHVVLGALGGTGGHSQWPQCHIDHHRPRIISSSPPFIFAPELWHWFYSQVSLLCLAQNLSILMLLIWF